MKILEMNKKKSEKSRGILRILLIPRLFIALESYCIFMNVNENKRNGSQNVKESRGRTYEVTCILLTNWPSIPNLI